VFENNEIEAFMLDPIDPDRPGLDEADPSDNSMQELARTPSREELNIAKEILELKVMMEDFSNQIKQFDITRQGFGEKIEHYRDEIFKLQQQDKEIKTKQFDIQRELRRLENERDQKERQLKQAADNRRLKEQFLEQTAAYEELIANAPWRDLAMKHQIEGGKILANARRAILGDKRGLGKTLTSQIFCDLIGAKKIVYVSPGDVLRTVEREIQHWTPHRTVAPLGMMPKKQRRFAIDMLKKLDQFIITINYEAWRKDLALLEDIAALKIDTVILDEAHVIKDPKSIAFRGVEKIVFAENSCPHCRETGEEHTVAVEKSLEFSWSMVPTCQNCGLQAGKDVQNGGNYEWNSVQNVLPMTGTPILNKPQDLFTQLNLIDRPNFYGLYQFLHDYCEQDLYTGKWKFKTGGLERLIKKMSSKFLVRDRKSAGVVLPEQHEVEYEIELTEEEYPKQWKYNRQLNEYAQILLDEDAGVAMNIMVVIALITRKRQMMTWPEGIKWVDPKTKEIIMQVSCDESVKIDRIIKIETITSSDEAVDSLEGYVVGDVDGLIPELSADGNMEEGERIVVMSQFKEALKEIERRCKLAGYSVVRYDGDTPRNIQDEVVVDFDRKYCYEPGYEKKWQIVLANYKKGGIGLNLTDATQMIILDEEWNPGKVDQAYGRIDRMGQTEETTVHVLRVKSSIDSWMKAIIDEKADMIEGFESAQSIAQDMLEAIRSGELI
jgi:SNF2 family DNA or RNA helicase